MRYIIVEHNDFQSTKNGFLIIVSIVSFLFLMANVWIGLIAIFLTISLWTLKVGIEFDLESRNYRYYKSFFGKRSGKWEDLNKFKAIIVLKKNMKGQMLSPKLVNELTYKHVVFDVNLTTASHRSKFSLKKYRSIDDAMDLAKRLSSKLKLPLESYNPIISENTKRRRQNRK